MYIDLSKYGTPDLSIWNRTEKIHFCQGRTTLIFQMSRSGLINYSCTHYLVLCTFPLKHNSVQSQTRLIDQKITEFCSCVPAADFILNRFKLSHSCSSIDSSSGPSLDRWKYLILMAVLAIGSTFPKRFSSTLLLQMSRNVGLELGWLWQHSSIRL